jgi:hypothetical protein
MVVLAMCMRHRMSWVVMVRMATQAQRSLHELWKRHCWSWWGRRGNLVRVTSSKSMTACTANDLRAVGDDLVDVLGYGVYLSYGILNDLYAASQNCLTTSYRTDIYVLRSG